MNLSDPNQSHIFGPHFLLDDPFLSSDSSCANWSAQAWVLQDGRAFGLGLLLQQALDLMETMHKPNIRGEDSEE